MMGSNAFVISPDEMARLVSGAGVTHCKGLFDKMQLTVITPKGMERRVDTECPGLKAGLEASSAKLLSWYTVERNLESVCQKHRA